MQSVIGECNEIQETFDSALLNVTKTARKKFLDVVGASNYNEDFVIPID